MHSYIDQHPLVVSAGRENHFFVEKFKEEITEENVAKYQNLYMRGFNSNALMKNLSLMTGTSAPSDVLHRYVSLLVLVVVLLFCRIVMLYSLVIKSYFLMCSPLCC